MLRTSMVCRRLQGNKDQAEKCSSIIVFQVRGLQLFSAFLHKVRQLIERRRLDDILLVRDPEGDRQQLVKKATAAFARNGFLRQSTIVPSREKELAKIHLTRDLARVDVLEHGTIRQEEAHSLERCCAIGLELCNSTVVPSSERTVTRTARFWDIESAGKVAKAGKPVLVRKEAHKHVGLRVLERENKILGSPVLQASKAVLHQRRRVWCGCALGHGYCVFFMSKRKEFC